MITLAKTSVLLIEMGRDKLSNLTVCALFKNNNAGSSIAALYVLLTRETETGNKKMEVAVFEDKKKPDLSVRWKALKSGASFFTGEELNPVLWEFIIRRLGFSLDAPVISCPLLTLADGKLATLMKKLEKTGELAASCKENLMKLNQLMLPADPEQALLGLKEEEIAEHIRTAFC